MKFKNVNLGRSDLLGRPATSPPPDLGRADVENWQRGLGYLSMFAGAAAIVLTQPSGAVAAEKDRAIPPRVARQAAELMKKLGSGSCSKPELLRRQSEYRLPTQKTQFNMLEILAGGDNCPGTPIPPGTYTAAAPFTDAGDTTGANNTVNDIPVACNGYYNEVRGPDHIYSFTMTARGANPEIRVSTTSNTYDLSIYILNGSTGAMCPAGTNNNVTNCIVGADNTFFATGGVSEVLDGGSMGVVPLNVPLYFFVDSYYNAPGGNGGTQSGPYTVRIQDITVGGGPTPPENDAPLDMDADGKTDFVLIRNVGGGTSGQVRWFTALNVLADGNPTQPRDWGIASDQFFVEDFDGDGKDDMGVYRPGSPGKFMIIRSLTNTLYFEDFGAPGDDSSVVGDYNGDGQADIALYRGGATSADQSFWFWRPLNAGGTFNTITWGQGGDTPAPGDYDGDGRNDYVVQRPDGQFGRFWLRMNTGAISTHQFGLSSDTVAPGDYDDDGKTDLMVVRDQGGFLAWHFKPSASPNTPVVSDIWGVSATDEIAQGDYDGDGRTDYAVYRTGDPGRFYIMTVGTRAIKLSLPWGVPGDYPMANFNTH